jgi:tetratricopeptide (TPR) repeat protein
MKKIYLISAIVLLNLFTLTAQSNGLKMTVTKSEYKYHSPAEFYTIMNKSTITYKLRVVDNLSPFVLNENSMESYSINPYHRIKYESVTKYSIIIDIPNEKIGNLFNMADIESEKGNYNACQKIYLQALSLDSTYFKTWTYLGDINYTLRDYTSAEKCILKSIELNDIGYQEYFILADIYNKLGRNEEAINAISYAYMLNKNNPTLQKALYGLLNRNGLKLRQNRLQFPFQIKKTGVSECEIQIKKEDGKRWIPMANCMACWEMEPDFCSQLQKENNWSAKVNMYKECLFNQGIAIETMKQKSMKLSPNEELLRDALFNKYINAIVYWEILAGELPQSILYLPKSERDQIVEYIKKYVYEK